MRAISGKARLASIGVVASFQLSLAPAAHAQVPSVTLDKATMTLREPGFDVQLGTPGFIVRRSIVNNTSLTVNYTIGGTATSGSDYVALSGTLTIGPGLGGVTLPIDIKNDTFTERDETIVIALSASSNYTLGPIKAGTVTVIDIDQKLRLTNVDAAASEPGQDNATVTIERLGTLSNSLTLDLQYFGTATAGTDFTAPSSVTFAVGDSLKTITIVPIADGTVEGNETILVKVPQFNVIGTTISLADAATTVSVNPSSVIEAQGNTANFVITRTGNLSQSVTVPFTVSGTATNGTDYNTVGSSVVIPAGAASANVPIVVKADAGQENAETVILTLGSSTSIGAGVPNSATLLIQDNVAPTVSALALSVASVIGGTPASGTVTLNGPAPAGGLPITLTSSSTFATVPASVTIGAGQSSATFSIGTTPRSTDLAITISAVAPTGTAQTQSLTVLAAVITTASLNKASVTAQAASDSTSVLGTVTLTGPAPSTGTSIQLSSSNPSVAGVLATVVVPASQSSATFKVTVVPLAANASATITATRGTISKTMNLAVNAPAVASITLSPTSLAGGTTTQPKTSTGTFTLDGPAPAAGLTATFSDNSDRISETPAQVFIPAGGTSGPLTVAVLAVSTATNVTVTAVLPGGNRNASLTIVPPTPQSITFDEQNIAGGQTAHGHLTLNGAAPVDGFTVPISSNSAAASPCTNVPITSISFPIGFGTKPFSLCTQVVAGPTTVTLTAGQGAGSLSVPVVIGGTGVTASSVVLTATDVNGGTGLNGTVTLSQPGASPNGSPVTISSNNAAVKFRPAGSGAAFTQTLALNVVGGQTSTGFQVSTSAVGQDTVVTVSASPGTASQGLTVRAPVLTLVNVNPTTVQGGASTTGHVSLSGDAPPGGIPVQLSTNSSLISLPSIVTVGSGLSGTNFTVTSSTVPRDTTAVITATRGPVQQTTTLTIAGPIALASMAVSPATIVGGTPTTLTLNLNTPAPTGGTIVVLTCSSPNVSLPATVTIPAGQTSTTVTVNTVVFGANTDLTSVITGALGGQTKTAQLVLHPLQITSVSFTPATPTGGTNVTASVQLDAPAPGTGITLALSSSNPAVVVPATLELTGGQSIKSFVMTTSPVAANTQVTVSATFQQAVRSGSLTVRTPLASAVNFTNMINVSGPGLVGTVLTGESTVMTVAIDGPAAAGGALVNLAVTPASFTAIPTSVTIPEGQSSTTVTVSPSAGSASTSVQIVASRPGVTGSVSRTLLVQSSSVISVSPSPSSVQGGAVVNVTAAVSPALFGFSLPVSATGTGASGPSSIFFNQGTGGTAIAINTTAVTSTSTVTITVGTGSGAKSTTLTITP